MFLVYMILYAIVYFFLFATGQRPDIAQHILLAGILYFLAELSKNQNKGR